MALEDRNSPMSACGPALAGGNGVIQGAALVPTQEISAQIKLEPEPDPISPEKTRYSSYSIDRFVNASSYEPLKREDSRETDRCESGPQDSTRIKFSVDNILKPDFGKCDPLKRTVTPIIRSEDLHKPRCVFNRRSFEVSRLPNPADFPKRRHSDEPTESVKEQPSRPHSAADGKKSPTGKTDLWPAWVYCTRYSDRPSSGPRSRRMKKREKKAEEKRPRTAFSGDQLSRLKHEFNENRYLTERRRQDLAKELSLNEAQIKIWFQNKRAKMKKAKGEKNPLALQLMAQGLYNHSTVALDEEEFLEELAMANHPKSP